jgi:hypothetical protein
VDDNKADTKPRKGLNVAGCFCKKIQKEHHKTENFYDEFKRLLIENEIEFDEKYLL